MEKLSHMAQSFWAKKAKDGSLFWLPLFAHLADTAAVMQKLWDHWLPEGTRRVIADGSGGADRAAQLALFLAAVHDLGKATPAFQSKSSRYGGPNELDRCIAEQSRATGLPLKPRSAMPYAGKTPHALAGQVLLEAAGCNRNAAVIIGAHHGKPPSSKMLGDCGVGSYPENYNSDGAGKEGWIAVQWELIRFALKLSGFASLKALPAPDMAAQTLLSGLLMMADWIASDEKYFSYVPLGQACRPDARARADLAWKQLALPSPWHAGNRWARGGLYEERFGFAPNAIQAAVARALTKARAPGILVLEAPMGSGKTEAALAAAEILADRTQRKGVFFALPTQATSDGMFPRMERWIDSLKAEGAHSIHLAHGKAEFNSEYQNLAHGVNIGEDEDAALFVHPWFEGRKRSMLDDFVVGTIDQLLFAALKQKHVMLRHLGLADKVVVIDECHSFDAYMNRYLFRALTWLGAYGVPVVVLSATLPARTRRAVMEAYLDKSFTPQPQRSRFGKIIGPIPAPPKWTVCRDYPLITASDGGAVRQEKVPPDGSSTAVTLEPLAEDSLADMLADLLSGGGCAGVVVNTVRRAQKMAQMLRPRFGGETVELFHSRFLACDRAEKEDRLRRELGKPGGKTRRPEKRIVVGTQVLEQSLDIDFDILITDLCPMDLLLQRIGRLHRHKRNRPAKLTDARCLVIGLGGDDFEPGAEAIYGRYLLMRTRARLPRRLTLPRDIPNLVQDVYGEKALLPDTPAYREAKREYDRKIQEKERRASAFRVDPPCPGSEESLVNWLNTEAGASEQAGEAAVRDGDESLEVLPVRQMRNGRLHFLPWIEGGRGIPRDEVPDEATARALARCSVRLPGALCAPWAVEQTVRTLETACAEQVPLWQDSPWLRGALFLILGEDGGAVLGGRWLTYRRDDGLFDEKEADDHA